MGGVSPAPPPDAVRECDTPGCAGVLAPVPADVHVDTATGSAMVGLSCPDCGGQSVHSWTVREEHDEAVVEPVGGGAGALIETRDAGPGTGGGLYGAGMHDWVCDEAELGRRVANALDDENNTGWSALHDLHYQRSCQQWAIERASRAVRQLIESDTGDRRPDRPAGTGAPDGSGERRERDVPREWGCDGYQ